ncbi:2'-5' RNA ligase family protein [Pseudofrankia asymbiotica]|uniref:2'-5' RNA ligase family protein n=1 Tax=Pseudofrankia asymbiotica TaxID=1834516 RepID=UPI0009D698C6|nr:2'-5' RNA ligase family protein [Pseudofrankia asymbiotica]
MTGARTGRDIPQRARFGALRAAESWRLRRGPAIPWRADEGPRAFLTTVVRVPETMGDRLREAARPAAEAGGHHLYPAASLHVTLINLDRHADVRMARLEQALADCVAAAPPVVFDLCGLAVARSTLYVQAYARPGRAVPSLRASILRRLDPAGRESPPMGAGLAFSNVVRFRSTDIAAAREVARARRADRFGSFSLEAVELVRTDKVMSAAGTEILAVFPARRRPR